MTTDTTAPQDRLWDAVAEVRDRYPRVSDDAPTDEVVSAVLPIIAEEVRAASEKAWMEGVAYALPSAETVWHQRHNPYRATEYKTGDRA